MALAKLTRLCIASTAAAPPSLKPLHPHTPLLKSSPCLLRIQARAGFAVSALGTMVKGMKIHNPGGPEVMQWEDVEIGEPGKGEVRIKQTAVGLNFIDVYFRNGLYKADAPFIPGMEGVGVVTAVGPGLTGRRIGDRVGYTGKILKYLEGFLYVDRYKFDHIYTRGGGLGAYVAERIMPADILVPIPDALDDVTAASIMLKGMTAQVLLHKCFKVEKGHTILVHAAAGGVGSLLVQWASSMGVTVIAAVSNEEKASQAKEDGAQHVIIYSRENFAEKVKEITKGAGVQVVYDSVGKDTLLGSVDCLAYRGYLVSFGQSSGPADPISTSILAPRSLYLTRPAVTHYIMTRDELLETAGDLFAAVTSGMVKCRTNQTYPLSQAAKAHADLEGRKTMGSSVLIP